MQCVTVSKCKLAPVIISGNLYIFKALVYFQSACVFSKRLYISKALVYFPSACITFPKRLYSNFLSVSQRLVNFLIVSQRYYYYFSALIYGCEAHNFLIMLLIILGLFLNVSNASINYVQNF